VFGDPFGFDACAQRYCRALSLGELPSVDGGTTPEAVCASRLAECISRNPQDTASCMAMLNQCMMRDF
jgi:hypothetical protein